jgi:hypothetical protein
MYSTNFVVVQLGKIRIWKIVIIIRLKLEKKTIISLKLIRLLSGVQMKFCAE